MWSAASVVAGVQVASVLARPPADRLRDLHVYYGAAHALLGGGSLYDFVAPNGAPFTYPPFAGSPP